MAKIIKISNVIGGALCVTSADGQKVFDIIQRALAESEDEVHLVISFEGIELVIPAFLNAAIGQLYGKYTHEDVVRLLRFTHLAPDDEEILKCVMANAVRYYENPHAFDKAFDEVVDAS